MDYGISNSSYEISTYTNTNGKPQSPLLMDPSFQIGQGSFSKVYKSSYTNKNGEICTVAVKKIPMLPLGEGFPISAVRELYVLNSFHHPNLISLLDVFIIHPKGGKGNKGHVDLIFEYMEHDIGALVDNHISFSLEEIKNIMFQILTGINYLHSNLILHRDIKSANILLNHDGVVKIGDFGLSRRISKKPFWLPPKMYTNNVVTLWYRAPELLLGDKNYTSKIDMWSIGCVFAELLMGTPIFKGSNERSQLNEILKIIGTPDRDKWYDMVSLPLFNEYLPKNEYDNTLNQLVQSKRNEIIDDDTFDLLKQLLTIHPSYRINVEDALAHSYFKNGTGCKVRKIEKEYHNFKIDNENKTHFRFDKDEDMIIGQKNKYENKLYYKRDAINSGKIIKIQENYDKNLLDKNQIMYDEAKDKSLLNTIQSIFKK
jgi:serine/threonine protein kinase